MRRRRKKGQSILYIRGENTHSMDETVLRWLRDREHIVSVAVDPRDALIKALNRTGEGFDVLISNGVRHAHISLREAVNVLETLHTLPKTKIVIADSEFAPIREFECVRTRRLLDNLRKKLVR